MCCWSSVVVTNDILETVTELVNASATARSDGTLRGAQVAKHLSNCKRLSRIHGIAALLPNMLVCIEETDLYESWALTAEGTARVEVVNRRINPTPLFQVQSPLPKIQDMSSYELVLLLEEQWSFAWCRLPRKMAEREAICFRPGDSA